MAISFNEVPPGVRVPWAFIEFDNSRAAQGPGILQYKMLNFGQKLAAGEAAADTPIRVTSAAQAITEFGQGSMLHNMAQSLFANNNFTEAWFVPLADDSGAVAAEGSIAYSGPSSAAGTIFLYVAGRRLTIGVASGDSADAVATNVASAINDNDNLPVTASAATGTVTVTAKNLGEAGNYIDLRHNYYSGEVFPEGVSATITDMSGGSANPDLSNAIANLGDDWYHVWAVPYTDSASLTAIKDELDRRFDASVQADGMAFTAADMTHSALGTLGNDHNSPHLSIQDAHESPSPPWEWAAALTGVVAFHGQQDPARPFQTLELEWVKAEPEGQRFTLSENNTLLYDGISTHQVGGGGKPRIQRLITTYKTNAAGADDTSYLDVTTLLTLMYLRWDWRTMWLTKYPRHKLADDGKRYGAGQAIMTPKTAKAEAIQRFRQWEEMGLVENPDQFKQDLIVERNASDPNRLDILMSPDLANQLRVTGVKMAFLL